VELIYPDNAVVRSLADKPETWDKLYDPFVNTFGRTFRLVKSCYLFFEYIGFTKKNLRIPPALKTPILDHQQDFAKMKLNVPKMITAELIDKLDKSLGKVSGAINAYIESQMVSLHPIFEDLVENREGRIASFEGSQELIKILFGDIITLMATDFIGFVKYATRYLAWDVFCSIHPVGLSLELIRERQLAYWLQFWEEGIELPFGKIIDDQAGYYDMNFKSKSHFKEFEDMVDAEMHTYLILGSKVDGALRSIRALAYPPQNQYTFEERNRLALGSITNIETRLEKTLVKHPGKLYELDPDTHFFKKVYEPMFKILL